jgi:hypothetical protein
MPTAQEQEERLAKLHDAYLWEQERIQAWLDDLANNPMVTFDHPDNEFDYTSDTTNPMVVRFLATWRAYFAEVQASNNAVMGICLAALGEVDAAKRAVAINDAVRRINRIEHRKGSVSSISNAANIHRRQSKYFKSLDAVIDLENEVRDYIEDYLINGKP